MTDTEEDAGMPWALLPNEAVCLDCRLTYHRPLGACPNCKENEK